MAEIEIVGRCEKCGREFITMPKDGVDHYDWRSGFRGNRVRRGDEKFEECGGAVLTLPTSQHQNTLEIDGR